MENHGREWIRLPRTRNVPMKKACQPTALGLFLPNWLMALLMTAAKLGSRKLSSLWRHTAGPDRVVSVFLRDLPCLLSPLTQLFNVIVDSGNIPRPMAQLFNIHLIRQTAQTAECLRLEKTDIAHKLDGEDAGSCRFKQINGAVGGRLRRASVCL